MRFASAVRVLGVAVVALQLAAAPAAAQQEPPRPPPAEAPTDDEAAEAADAAERVPATVPAAPAGRTPAPRTAAPRDTVPGDTVPADTVPATGEEARDAARRAAAEEAASDTIYQTLRRLEGYTAMEYRGDSATFRTDERVLRLFGPAEVTREGDRLTAEDTLVYRERRQLVEAYGSPTMSGQAETIEGNVMFYDLATRRATVRGGRTQVAEAGASWFVRGDVTAEGTNRLYATRSTFTTDDREEPAYFFESDDIKVIRDRILVGRPARLYFRNVPVFWLPFVAQDLTRGRRSGLLAPEFSINDIVRNRSSGPDARGTGRRISNLGFYWAISEYMDAQVSGGWQSGHYSALTGALQYRWNAQFLTGDVRFTRFWREAGNREFSLYSNNSWRPDERTTMSVNANFAASQFLREVTTDFFQSTQSIGSNLKMNRRFDWGTVDIGANRQQSMANDQVTMELPSIGLMLQPITLFREVSPDRQRWYSNATLNLNASGRRNTTTFGAGAAPHQRDETQTRVQAAQSFSMGNLGLNTSFNLNRLEQPPVAPIQDLAPRPRVERDEGRWQANLSYRIALIGETSLSPTLSLAQDFRAGTFGRGSVRQIPFVPEPITTDGNYVTSPLRTSFGTSLNTALYGFLPGLGPFSAIRHKITPNFSYSYVPEVQLTPEQERIFGRGGGLMQNNLQLVSLNQTFEAKMREEPGRDGARGATGAEGDTIPGEAGENGAGLPGAPAAPPQDRKVTLLSINTSGFTYNFAPDTLGRRVGFTTRQVTNTIASDYMRGLTLTMTHDLFDQSDVPFEERTFQLGRFSPRLTGLSTRFSLGEGSALLRLLGLTGRVREAPEPTDSIATEPRPSMPIDPTARSPAHTANPQAVGRGPWRLDVGYTLRRPRDGGTRAHDLLLGSSFSPTPNWSVNWHTNYSIEDGAFGGHRITLRRDLYRWEANFNFDRTPHGNTSFGVLIRLKDLPDLKVDYREDNIGATGRR